LRRVSGDPNAPQPPRQPWESPAPPPQAPPPQYPPAQQPYPPQYPPQYVQPARTNGFAVAALVLGIIWIYWIGSILALVFGYVAKGQIDSSNGTQSGRGMAIAGIVLGWVGVGILLLMLVLVAAGSISWTL
jgi:hypothetical protein